MPARPKAAPARSTKALASLAGTMGLSLRMVASESEKRSRIERRLGDGSDAELVEAVIDAIAVPRRAARSSFLLHAPLELLARVGLLPLVEPGGRTAARARIAEVGRRFLAAGEPLVAPTGNAPLAERLAVLVAALDQRAALESVDEAASGLSVSEARAALAGLAPRVVDHLGAAAHAPILLVEIQRVLGRFAGAAGLLRAPLCALTEQAGARIAWIQGSRGSRSPAGAARPPLDEAQLATLLDAPPTVRIASQFILPTVEAVDALCAERLGGLRLDVAQARPVLLRAAAWSMIEDEPAHGPYGWSHALTLPAATLALGEAGLAPTGLAVDVAATMVVAFRATLSRRALSRAVPAENAAAREAWSRVVAGDEEALRRELATRAAARRDAHLAKYALACFDAAALDPAAAPIYFAAAATLDAIWSTRPDDPE